MLFPTWSTPMDHRCFSHTTFVGGTSKAGSKAIQKKGRWEILGCCSVSCPCNMRDKSTTQSLWPPLVTSGALGQEAQRVSISATTPKDVAWIWQIFEDCLWKRACKAQCHDGYPIPYHAGEAGGCASHPLMLGCNHTAVPGPHGPEFHLWTLFPLWRERQEGGITWENSLSLSLSPSQYNELKRTSCNLAL